MPCTDSLALDSGAPAWPQYQQTKWPLWPLVWPADTTQDFAGGTGFSQTVTTVLRKLVGYVIKVRRVLCIKSVKSKKRSETL